MTGTHVWEPGLEAGNATINTTIIVATYEDDWHTYQAFGNTQANATLALNRVYQAQALKHYPENVGHVLTYEVISYARVGIGSALIDGDTAHELNESDLWQLLASNEELARVLGDYIADPDF